MNWWQQMLAWLFPSPKPDPPLFVGDYRTGDFNQYQLVQNKLVSATPNSWRSTGSYPAQIIDGVARYEVRDGDVMAYDGRERSEVSTDALDLGAEGQTLWYKFSTRFDPTFPNTWSESDWGVTNQWHAENALKISPPIAFGYGFGGPSGHWVLVASATGVADVIWDASLDPGSWHDVVMEVRWSQDAGTIRLWHNGVPQTFGGEATWHGQTLANGNSGVYYKEGLYRKLNGMSATGIVYHRGFVCAATESSLYA